MKKGILIIFLFSILCSQQNTAITKRVNYIESTIMSSNDGMLKLLDGSMWYANTYAYILPITEIIIVVIDKDIAYGFFGGNKVSIELLKGRPVTKSGLFSYVVNEYGKGAVIELEDGSKWNIPQYDRYDTGWWMPPYPVLITSNELYMINLEKGKKVWVSRSN